MSTSSYRAEAGTIQGRLDMVKYITMPKGELAGRVLLVDDLADSGVTLQAVVERLRGMPRIRELRSAVIWVKGVSGYTPDYFVEMLPTSPGFISPFEEYDELRPDGPAQDQRSYVLMAIRGTAPAHREVSGPFLGAGSDSLDMATRSHRDEAGFSSSKWCPGEDSNLHGVTR